MKRSSRRARLAHIPTPTLLPLTSLAVKRNRSHSSRRAQILVSLADIRAGRVAAPCCSAELPRVCAICQAVAVLPLNPETRMAQPDATTHVCHPVLGGCNHGFTVYNV
jgi:hypothetical protein